MDADKSQIGAEKTFSFAQNPNCSAQAYRSRSVSLLNAELLATNPDCSEIDRRLLLNIHSLVMSAVDKRE